MKTSIFVLIAGIASAALAGRITPVPMIATKSLTLLPQPLQGTSLERPPPKPNLRLIAISSSAAELPRPSHRHIGTSSLKAKKLRPSPRPTTISSFVALKSRVTSGGRTSWNLVEKAGFGKRVRIISRALSHLYLVVRNNSKTIYGLRELINDINATVTSYISYYRRYLKRL
ncbi:hypothetical protein V8F20_012337 [Naviculisporaceae sp. PSN 640]